MSNTSWIKRKERGSLFLIRFISWLAINLGRPVGRVLLYPITLYFVLFMPYARKSSTLFLTRALGIKPGFRQLFRHFHTFAATILDRVFLLSGHYDEYQIEVEGMDVALKEYHKNRGCILMGSHLGSFDLLRTVGNDDSGIKYKALMYGENSEKVSSVLNILNPELASSMIPVGKSNTMLLVQDALAAGELVGVLADRHMNDSKVAVCDFYNQKVRFPTAPVLLGGLLNVPVLMFFAVCTGNKSYRIHFELLSDEVIFDRSSRKKVLEQFTQQYVLRLEHYSKKYPYNWFNFFDYWHEIK